MLLSLNSRAEPAACVLQLINPQIYLSYSRLRLIHRIQQELLSQRQQWSVSGSKWNKSESFLLSSDLNGQRFGTLAGVVGGLFLYTNHYMQKPLLCLDRETKRTVFVVLWACAFLIVSQVHFNPRMNPPNLQSGELRTRGKGECR